MNKTFVLSAVLAAGVFSGVSAAEAPGTGALNVEAAQRAFDLGQPDNCYQVVNSGEGGETRLFIRFLILRKMLGWMDRDGQLYGVVKDSEDKVDFDCVGMPLERMSDAMKCHFMAAISNPLPASVQVYLRKRCEAEEAAERALSVEGTGAVVEEPVPTDDVAAVAPEGAEPTWDVTAANAAFDYAKEHQVSANWHNLFNLVEGYYPLISDGQQRGWICRDGWFYENSGSRTTVGERILGPSADTIASFKMVNNPGGMPKDLFAYVCRRCSAAQPARAGR